jgi:membrane fusion protein (multidrug efflux system)
MKKPMTKMIIGLSIVFGGLIAFNLIKQIFMHHFFAHYKPPAVSVSSVTVEAKNWEPKIHVVGNFSAINGVEVNSQASGNVVAIHFESGQFIEANQPLVDIDDSVEQATLKFNQADLALQSINYKRQADLLKRNATANANVDEAQAKLLEAQANVEKTQALIQQKHIRSPFAGQLGLRDVNLGEYITPGQTTIVTLQSLDSLFMEFYVPEQLLNHLHLGQTVTASLEQQPNLRFAGKVTAINSKVDTQTHNIKIQATFPNCPADDLSNTKKSQLIETKLQSDGQTLVLCDAQRNAAHHVSNYAFIPGMFASIDIEQPPIPNVLVLPSTAISYSLYGNSVFVIEKEPKEDDAKEEGLIVKRVFVSTGQQEGNQTVITKGLKAGQQVVSTGELKLQNGTRVVINNAINLASVTNLSTLKE